MKSVLLMAGLAASANTALGPTSLEEFLKLSTSINYISNGNFELSSIGNRQTILRTSYQVGRFLSKQR